MSEGLPSTQILTQTISLSLALCERITKVVIKAMKCLDVPHTSGRFCVQLL